MIKYAKKKKKINKQNCKNFLQLGVLVHMVVEEG
jgi:hypothetical protein